MSEHLLKINRPITEQEYERMLDICEREVAENRIVQNGKYFREVNHELSFYKDNQWLNEFKILAKGEYFTDRVLVYGHKHTYEEVGIICLDDHSMGEINRKCANELKRYLLSIGAKEYDD